MPATIRIRKLPANCDVERLLRLCACFGEVSDFKRVGEEAAAPGNGDVSVSSTAIVDVVFDEKEDAMAAVGNMEGMQFEGRFLTVLLKQ